MSSFVAGLALGAGLSAVGMVVGMRRHRVDPDARPLTDTDREAVATEFATHAEAVRRQVSEYADALAGDDAVLRERLRRFEDGES